MKFSYFQKKEHVTFRFDKHYKRLVKAAAKCDNMSISNWFAQTAIEFLQLPAYQKLTIAAEMSDQAVAETVMTNFMVAPPLLEDIDKDAKSLDWHNRSYWFHAAIHYKINTYRYKQAGNTFTAFRLQEETS
jgi:hypothetical protein